MHRDALGYEQAIRPGDINLMVAGSGIVHSERERPEMMESDRRLHGLQLWLALPEADEETPPEFLHYPSNDIPALTLNEVPVRVMLGSAYGVTSPVKTFAETLYVEATLQAGQRLSIPDVAERAVYVAGGEVEINGELVPEFALATLDTASGLEIIAKQPSRIAIIGGENIGHRYVWWNFVSSRKQRIEQAKQDWAEGRFPLVPGDDAEFIPLPEK